MKWRWETCRQLSLVEIDEDRGGSVRPRDSGRSVQINAKVRVKGNRQGDGSRLCRLLNDVMYLNIFYKEDIWELSL